MKVRKVRRLPECPVCGANTSKKHASSRRLPFCTLKCAAEYGQRTFRSDPRIWDTWLHKWGHKDNYKAQARFVIVAQDFHTVVYTNVWKDEE